MTAFPMTSLATVYKTVDMLKAEGEILELGFANGISRYVGSKSYPHPHLICIKCQTIIDPEVDLVNELTQEIATQYGYKIVYELSLPILNEEVEHELWFSEFLGEGPSGHFMHRGETSPLRRQVHEIIQFLNRDCSAW